MMTILDDDCGQGSSEYILLFGAIIVVAILALVIYRSYFQKSSLNSAQDMEKVRSNTEGSGDSPSALLLTTPHHHHSLISN